MKPIIKEIFLIVIIFSCTGWNREHATIAASALPALKVSPLSGKSQTTQASIFKYPTTSESSKNSSNENSNVLLSTRINNTKDRNTDEDVYFLDSMSVAAEPSSSTVSSCGHRNVNGIMQNASGPNDVNRNVTHFGEFPWMMAIFEKTYTPEPEGKTIYEYLCGGSLINRLVVLTAAHCVSGKPTNILKVRAGEWDLTSKDEFYPSQDRDVAQVVVHEDFKSASLQNDISLLFLLNGLDLEKNINLVCLPPPQASLPQISSSLILKPLDEVSPDNSANKMMENLSSFELKNCYATGWGKNAFNGEVKYQTKLKKIDLEVIPQQTCETVLRKTRLSSYFKLHDSFVCASGYNGMDTCTGDGGSPLVCPIKGQQEQQRYYQVGIVAWGIGCGKDNLPGVYADVSYFRGWVDKIVTGRGLTAESYIYGS